MPRNKSLVFLLGAAAAGVLTTHAQTAPSAPLPGSTIQDMSIDVTPTYVSQYMFRGQRLGGQSVHVPIEGVDGPWTVGVWADAPIHNTTRQSDPEVDYYGNYAISLGGNLDLKPGLTLYTYPENGLSGAFGRHLGVGEGYYRSTFEPSLALDYSVAGLRLTPAYSYDTVLRGSNYELAALYAIPMSGAGTELDFNGSAGCYLYSDASHIHDNAGSVRSKGNYWTLGASVPFQVIRNVKLTVGWDYEYGDGHLQQGAAPQIANPQCVGRGVFSASLGYRF